MHIILKSCIFVTKALHMQHAVQHQYTVQCNSATLHSQLQLQQYNSIYVTLQAKTSLVHTSKIDNLEDHNSSQGKHNQFIFRGFVDPTSLDHCFKYQPLKTFLTIFTSGKIGGVNQAGFCSDSHNYTTVHHCNGQQCSTATL